MDICWNGDDMRLRCSLSYPDISCVCQLQKQKNGIQVFLSEKRHSALPFIRSDGSYRHICIAMHWGFVYGLWKLADMYIGLFIAIVKMIPNFLLLSMSGVQGTQVVMITWYISAMLIAMLVIYPLLRKYKDTYTLIIAPVTALLISGYFYNTVGYNGFTKFEGVITHGILRAFVGLNIGCLVYMFAEYLKKKEFRPSVKRLLGIAELLLYLLAIFMMHDGGKTCVFYNNILLLFAISITASKQSAISGVFDNKVSKFLGEMSLFIYLCQSPARATVRYIFPDVSYWTGFAYIVGLTFVSVAFGMILIHWIARMNRQKTQLK